MGKETTQDAHAHAHRVTVPHRDDSYCIVAIDQGGTFSHPPRKFSKTAALFDSYRAHSALACASGARYLCNALTHAFTCAPSATSHEVFRGTHFATMM